MNEEEKKKETEKSAEDPAAEVKAKKVEKPDEVQNPDSCRREKSQIKKLRKRRLQQIYLVQILSR